MNLDPHTRERFQALREEAERLLRERPPASAEPDARDLPRLIKEIEVHQTELALQNQELERAQAALEASRNEYESLFEAAPVGYVTLNRDGLILRANSAAFALLGYEHQLRHRPFSSFIRAEDHPLYYDYLNRTAVRRPEHTDPVEVRVAGPAGTVHVRIQATTERKARGDLFRWRLVLVDVTRRREAEEALQASEAQARAEAERRRHLAGRLVALLEEDRRSTAMTLHDDIGQILAGVKMQLESARADPDGFRQLEQAAEDLRDAITRLRSKSRQLHPASLSVLGLEAALRSLTEEAGGGGCRLRFLLREVPSELDPDHALAVFRIAQESVVNASRHSGCREIHVSLAAREGALHLTVEDDGCGFEWGQAVSEASGEGPLGLLIMRERAVHAGGSLHVDTSPGRGTVVTAEIPLEAPPPPREPL